MHITVTGPPGGRPAAPVAARIPMQRIDDDRMMGLVDMDTGLAVPVQMDSRARLCWVERELQEGEVRRYKMASAGFLADVSRVVVCEQEDGSADIVQNGSVLAHYRGISDAHRPFLTPLHSPAGVGVTVDAAESTSPLAAGTPHHHSCWCGWGDVNGVDHWTDAATAGRQRHIRFTLSSSGPVFGRLSALIEWLDPAGARQMVEQRVFTIYAYAERARIIAVASRFLMTDGPVTFGDTTDGGMCAVRVAAPLTPSGGGVLRNANGEEGEEDCWGAAAEWCDFTGQVEDRFVGVTMMDCPNNLKHPTLWNVRDDGLMAANPFGLSSFIEDPNISGARTFEAGETVMFRYRLLIHDSAPTPEEIDRMAGCFSRSLDIAVD